MVIHLGIQDALGERLFQTVEKSVRIKGRLRIGPSQQLVQDGIRNMRFFASRHGWAPSHPSCPPKHEIPDSLTQEANPSTLADLSGRWIDRVHARRPVMGTVLDMDSSVSPTFGEQEGSAYNGHFGCTCYHPLFVFNQFGDLERCALRPGNVHSAEGWRDVL